MSRIESRRGSAPVVAYCAYATVVLWMAARPVTALPPDPDNAALLYYQACPMPPEPLNPRAFDLVVRGADPNETSRKYLNRCESRDTLELLQVATEMSRCDWGVISSRGRTSRLMNRCWHGSRSN